MKLNVRHSGKKTSCWNRIKLSFGTAELPKAVVLEDGWLCAGGCDIARCSVVPVWLLLYENKKEWVDGCAGRQLRCVPVAPVAPWRCVGCVGGRLGALISEWRVMAERGAGQCVDIVVCDDVHCQHSGDGLNNR